MIYLFTGDDAKTKRSAYEKFLKSLPNKADLLFINRNNFNKLQVESLYSGAGLFTPKSTVVFEGILEYEDNRDFILDKLSLMGNSGSEFIFLEGKLTKLILDVFKKGRAELNIFELPKEKKEKFDNFLVANAFGAKDKLNMWVYFRQAMDRGVGMEEIIGVLFWKIKDMILKRDFRKFSEPELKNSAARLSYLLPEARTKGEDAEAAFEQFLLEVF
ncbi:MAG: hypothetical protein KBD17_00690 [Candidatus Pacebacteria bacterium]|nr:hypothetical protein [Candidatus Paceibacterota bacterium]